MPISRSLYSKNHNSSSFERLSNAAGEFLIVPPQVVYQKINREQIALLTAWTRQQIDDVIIELSVEDIMITLRLSAIKRQFDIYLSYRHLDYLRKQNFRPHYNTPRDPLFSLLNVCDHNDYQRFSK